MWMCLLPTQTPALLLRFLGPLYLRWTSLPLREEGKFFTASQMDGEYRMSLTFGKCEVEEADFFYINRQFKMFCLPVSLCSTPTYTASLYNLQANTRNHVEEEWTTDCKWTEFIWNPSPLLWPSSNYHKCEQGKSPRCVHLWGKQFPWQCLPHGPYNQFGSER